MVVFLPFGLGLESYCTIHFSFIILCFIICAHGGGFRTLFYNAPFLSAVCIRAQG